MSGGGVALSMNGPAAAANGARPGALAGRAVSVRGAWVLAGLLFVVGAVTTVPATFLLDEFEPWKYAFVGGAVLTGVICLLVPGNRVTARLLVVVPVIATVEVAVAIAFTDLAFNYLYFFVALYVGLVFPRLRATAAYLVLILAALLAPVAYESGPVREPLLWALAEGPGLIFTALVVGRLTLGLERSREDYRRLSGEDGLTGVGNYRSMVERLHHEGPRHARRRREFAVLTFDLDNFKQVNEAQGHLVGDLLLATVASALDLEVRTEDSVFRQGGDEFAVIAPETGLRQAMKLAARLEQAISRITSGPIRLSATVGVAIYPHDGADPATLLDAADADLLARRRSRGLPVR
jgi:diguanylate cyclase (GGDEF)-like protein